MSDIESLQTLANRIREAGGLGRSQHIRKLFDFLIECSATGRAPKETEVAIEVFGKDTGFDVAQDAMVRVYVHKLRRRLEEYYSGSGRSDPCQLTIPIGAYRIVIHKRDAAPASEDLAELLPELPISPRASRRWIVPVLAASVVILSLIHI